MAVRNKFWVSNRLGGVDSNRKILSLIRKFLKQESFQ